MSARAAGVPFDQSRTIRFELLADHLRGVLRAYPALPIDAERRATLPFWEAYFSNFIEGTEFTPEEAERIVFHGDVPPARPADAHDVLGTYRLVADETEMRRRTASADEFIEMLRSWHRVILGGRPDKRPGEFKRYLNQAGNTVFVNPDLVEGRYDAATKSSKRSRRPPSAARSSRSSSPRYIPSTTETGAWPVR